jgi:hypothetical protein
MNFCGASLKKKSQPRDSQINWFYFLPLQSKTAPKDIGAIPEVMLNAI